MSQECVAERAHQFVAVGIGKIAAACDDDSVYAFTIEKVKENLICSISTDYVRDLALVIESGHTYDKVYICMRMLSEYPNVARTDQSTSVTFDATLQYVDDVSMRCQIADIFGLVAYIKYESTTTRRTS